MANTHVLVFALMLWLMPLKACVKIALPQNATKNAPVQVNLTFEKGDPKTFFLKKYRLDENKFASPIFPVDSSNESAIRTIPFTTAQRYIVAALADPQGTNLNNVISISNDIQIYESTGQDPTCSPDASHNGGGTGVMSSVASEVDTRRSLSGGTIAAITFGVLIFVIVVSILVYLYHSRGRFSLSSRGMSRHYSSRVRNYLRGQSRHGFNRKPPPPSTDPEAYPYLSRLSSPRPVQSKGITVNDRATLGTQKSITAPSITTLNVSPVTERQSEIHQRLYELQDRLLRLQRNEELGDMSARKAIEVTESKIVALRSFVDSPWALHMTDEIPTRLKQCL